MRDLSDFGLALCTVAVMAFAIGCMVAMS